MAETFPKSEFTINDLIIRCSTDAEFRRDFIQNTREVLERYLADVPSGVEFKVVEVPAGTIVLAINPLFEEEASDS